MNNSYSQPVWFVNIRGKLFASGGAGEFNEQSHRDIYSGRKSL